MNAYRQRDTVSWWNQGRLAKARGYDIEKTANALREPARTLFLAGAIGEPKPSRAAFLAAVERSRQHKETTP